MNYKIKHTRQVVFLFIAIPVVLLILAVAFIAIKQNMFEQRFYYYTSLQDANGISTQTQILYKGFEIGRINDFNLTPHGDIRIRFYVLKRYNSIMTVESVISRTNNPITGRTLLEYIKNPSSVALLPDGSEILSTDFPEGRALFREISPRSVDAIAAIIENVNNLTTELNRDDNADSGALFRFLTSLADATQKTDRNMEHIESILLELRSFSANLNEDRNADAGAIFRSLNTMADITEKIDAQMVQVEAILGSISKTVRNFENPDSLLVKMIDPTGENLVLPLRKTILTLNANLEETYSLLNTINRNNPELLILINNLSEALVKANKTLEGINNNPLIRSGISPSQTGSNPAPGRIMELPLDE
ncbi:MAG: MlaD family protein [Candidatus Cloacimonadaceae bacterium]|nr:MlaD family protein [Candidatus Cloacimonadaceae bacterium]